MKTFLLSLALLGTANVLALETISTDIAEFNINNISTESKEITISPVKFEGKNVFAKFTKGYYQGIDSKEEYKEALKESADRVCTYLGLKESTDNHVVFRDKPEKGESSELVGINYFGTVYSFKAEARKKNYEIALVRIFKDEEYYDGMNGTSVKGVINSAGMLVSLPFQIAYSASASLIDRDYGIFTSITCLNF